jgi:tRNA G18 (ribose-2'-O)-methylase SpoU
MSPDPDRNYFGIGIVAGKTPENLGTLWRSAYQLGAAFIFTVGTRYKRNITDTTHTWQRIPLFRYESVEDLRAGLYDCRLVAVEMGGVPLPLYRHPARCAYLLGAEDNGLSRAAREACVEQVAIPAARTASYNVAMAGTIVMYDRWVRGVGR